MYKDMLVSIDGIQYKTKRDGNDYKLTRLDKETHKAEDITTKLHILNISYEYEKVEDNRLVFTNTVVKYVLIINNEYVEGDMVFAKDTCMWSKYVFNYEVMKRLGMMGDR